MNAHAVRFLQYDHKYVAAMRAPYDPSLLTAKNQGSRDDGDVAAGGATRACGGHVEHEKFGEDTRQGIAIQMPVHQAPPNLSVFTRCGS